MIFHLLPNAHLDPVWLWDWREGLNEGLITCRTILDLMDEDRELTFNRGESAIYEHIERTDPQTFARIKKYVAQGRWDVIGGTYIQPDTNLPHTETFARHYLTGIRYFQEKFKKRVQVAWAADSFGHAEGMPEILAAAGMKGIGFCRPDNKIVPIDQSAFWWEGPGGSRVMGYRPAVGWYGSERHEMPERLDGLLADARGRDLENVGVFFGLGNHGGGPTRRHIADVRAWAAAHPQVTVRFSTLHGLIDALYAEVKKKGEDLLPTHRGELNFVLRGCYSSIAKFKFLYRKTENHLLRAEKTDAAISAVLKRTPADMGGAWKSLLFNSFHDILPGSSIERAFEDQIAWLGRALHETQRVELSAINALAAKVDTTVRPVKGDMPTGVAFMVFNPLGHEYRGLVELEASLDYRPIWKYHNNVDAVPVRVLSPGGKVLAQQITHTEHSSMVQLAWRKRVLVPMRIPALGWSVMEVAYVEEAKTPKVGRAVSATKDRIDNGIYSVACWVGGKGIEIRRKGKSVFTGEGLSAITVEDPWGSWGGMAEEPGSLSLSTVRHEWVVTKTELIEAGPLRGMLWVRMEGGKSSMELTCSVSRGRDAVDVSARVMWNERSARLKLVMPVGKGELRAEYQVPGGTVVRGAAGEVPGGRWVRVKGAFGFASDGIYNFDQHEGALRGTVCRATRYANDVNTPAEVEPWRAAVDAGELKFRFVISPGGKELARLAMELEQGLITLPVPPHGGEMGREGSLGALSPESVEMLAFKPAGDGRGYVLRIQEKSKQASKPRFVLGGRVVKLPATVPGVIQTYRVLGGKARAVSIAEED